MRIHLLSPGFETQNGRAFLFPLIAWRDALREHGLDCRFFRELSPALTDCDVLLVDSKFHRDRWKTEAETDAVIDEFAGFASRCRVVYCDTTDSSGWIQTELLPIVHSYAKSQLLKDRELYRRPMYGHRLFTDYYHRHAGVVDDGPEWSQAVKDASLLSKLRLSWNSGLADYSRWGPTRMALYNQVPLKALLHFPGFAVSADHDRPHDLMCRFTVEYPRATVSHQRRRIRELLGEEARTRKVSRGRYFQELADTKIIVSPFGYGEINWRDYEAFLTGGLLLKPDMSHMETWPDLFRNNETILVHRWDLSDFEATLANAIQNYASLRALAQAGQDRYRQHLVGGQAAALFCRHLSSLVAA